MKKPVITAISGIKNSGKTTLITRLICEFKARGYSTAVIKHDGHDFACDIPGTDSYSFAEAGAYGTAVFSQNRMFVHKTGTGETEKELIGLFPEADIILLEGFKNSDYPKLEIIRSEISDKPVTKPEGRFLIVTDFPKEHFDEPCLDLNDIAEIADRILIH